MATALQKRVRLLEEDNDVSADCAKQSADFTKYALDPVGYARDVHGLKLTPKQEEILIGLITPPYRVLAPSANTQGKSFIGALAVSWWYDTRPVSISITTANTQAQVEEILWGYIRDQRTKAGLGGFKSAVAPRLWSSPTHWARGYTANTGTSFHGRHNERVLIVIDEAVEIGNDMLIAAESMLQGEEYAFLCLYNPTDPTSIMRRLEENDKGYRIVRLAATEHPNVIAELAGQPRPFPGAVTLDWVRNTIQTHSEVIPPPSSLENLPKNIVEFDGQWYRLEGEVEARVYGRWPSEGEFSVWSQLVWDKVLTTDIPFDSNYFQIGVDVAWYGRDRTVFVVRRGGNLVSIKSVQGWAPETTHDYCRQLAWEVGQQYRVPDKQIPIVVDDIGLGGKVMQAGDRFSTPHDGYKIIGLSVSDKALDEEHYPNKRSELWIETAHQARDGKMSFKHLAGNKALMHDLKNQFFAAKYTYRGKQKVVEKKEVQKEYLGGRSPDEADAIMLAFANVRNIAKERVTGHVRA